MDNVSLRKLEVALEMAEQHIKSEVYKEKGPILNLLLTTAAYLIQMEQGRILKKEMEERK